MKEQLLGITAPDLETPVFRTWRLTVIYIIQKVRRKNFWSYPLSPATLGNKFRFDKHIRGQSGIQKQRTCFRLEKGTPNFFLFFFTLTKYSRRPIWWKFLINYRDIQMKPEKDYFHRKMSKVIWRSHRTIVGRLTRILR